MEDAEADAEEVNEVWEMQKRALSDSITPGRRTWLEYRQAVVRPHPLLRRAQSRPGLHLLPHHQRSGTKHPCQVYFSPYDRQPLCIEDAQVQRASEVGGDP